MREFIPAQLRIGTSGWHYKGWKGCFYPPELKSSQYLNWYIRHFNTVEINNCFYRLPTVTAVESWRDQTSRDFLFAVKASRFLTHIKRLRDAGEALNTYLDRMELLQRKLGPILFQLPPNWHVNPERLQEFLELLPGKNYQYVFEFRDPTWYSEPVYGLLRKYNAALCWHDWHNEQSPIEITADFTYIRFHGTTGRYAGSYTGKMLELWADRISHWMPKLRSIYAYFNNDVGGHAVRNAQALRALLAGKEQEPSTRDARSPANAA